MLIRWGKRRYSDVRGCCGWSRSSSGCEPLHVGRRAGRGRRGKTLAPQWGTKQCWAGLPEANRRGGGVGSKVGDRHLARVGVVYVRQSTRQQVADHGESTRLQYGLVERAVGLGWPASRVLVIDQDLGKSGASTAGRVGFQRLVTEITMGHVGLVLGLEMSRLARSGADWYQLLELCALSGALLADADGVYDPVEFNDRLLLGLKGDDERGRAAPAQAADAGRQA